MSNEADMDLDEDPPDRTGRLIRPYAITGGRTGAESDIRVETLIQATPKADELVGGYRWEAVDLINLCRSPMALMEVAARLGVPIGVAKVLITDLVSDGALQLQAHRIEKNYVSLLERVLDGVRNL